MILIIFACIYTFVFDFLVFVQVVIYKTATHIFVLLA